MAAAVVGFGGNAPRAGGGSKAGIIGDRRRRRTVEETRKPPERKKHIFIVSGGVPFEIDIKYAPRAVLGDGSYGVVCSCVNVETNEAVAIKKIADALSLRTLREIQILRRIGRHKNIISLKDVMLSSSSTLINDVNLLKADFRHVYLVQELMDCDLGHVIKSAGLSWDHVKYLLFQILRGLKFLHSANIIHRDLKPQNILVNKNCDLKICDFGLARTKREDPQRMTTGHMGTRWYMAPELLGGSAWYGNGVDMWSVGCILAEMLGGGPIFPGDDSLSQINVIYEMLGTHSDLSFVESERFRDYLAARPYSPGVRLERLYPWAEPLAVDLLSKMLVLDPLDRVSASQALDHPYFSGVYDPVQDGWAPTMVSLEVDENPGGVDEKMIRDLIWEEMLFYHPEERTYVVE